jgi:hypothetical protein
MKDTHVCLRSEALIAVSGNCCLLGLPAVYFGRKLSNYRRIFSLILEEYPEDGGTIFFRNLGNCFTDYTALDLKRQRYSKT